MQEMTTCLKPACRNAQDFSELCETCQSDFDAWVSSQSDFDAWIDEMNAWVEEMERQGLTENSPPDFDPTEFDQWTLKESSVYLYGKPEPEPPICTRCGRVTSDRDPDVRYRHGTVVACGCCAIQDYEADRKRKATIKCECGVVHPVNSENYHRSSINGIPNGCIECKPKHYARRCYTPTTQAAAERYCRIFSDAYILNGFLCSKSYPRYKGRIARIKGNHEKC